MTSVGVHEAKTRLSELLQEVEAGGEVTITRHGRPVATLSRFSAGLGRRRGYGAMRSKVRVVHLTWDELKAGDADVTDVFGLGE